MKEKKEYVSVFGPYMQSFVEEKRALGYRYVTEESLLHMFDRYWAEHGNGSLTITQESLNGWLAMKPGQSLSYQKTKAQIVKFFSIYMNAHGHKCYVPLEKISVPRPVVHVLNKDEIVAFFHQVDHYKHAHNSTPERQCMEMGYPVIFRLILSCGLRNGEACSIRYDDLDLEQGTIDILNAKGQKDRRVYLAEDMKQLLTEHCKKIKESLGYQPYWLFIGKTKGSHITRTSLDYRFSKCWKATSFAGQCSKKPTVHCLRHSFTVFRINQWIAEGVDFEVMLPYLSKFLGHKSYEETHYYYHLIDEAFETIHKKDKTADSVIKGAKRR